MGLGANSLVTEAVSTGKGKAGKTMDKLSVLVGIVGVLGSGLTAVFLGRRRPNPLPGRYWVCGLTALPLAWLISLLALLGQWTGQGPDTPLPPSVILSSSGALVGVIVTDWAVRRLDGKGPARHPVTY